MGGMECTRASRSVLPSGGGCRPGVAARSCRVPGSHVDCDEVAAVGRERRLRGRATFAFVLWGALGPDSLGTVMGDVLGWIIGNFGWVFILIAVGALALCVFLVILPWGRIRL